MPSKLHFKVIHASGQDDVFRASELNHHSPLTKGWQSSRYCLYPQDMVIQLESRSRLRKIQILAHQYLIPTKIEFFVGDVPDGTLLSLDNARYARLGYVSLSDNEKTGFNARELKSVHVDAVGHYLKLNIHKNHVNKHNLYNQVGIIAINVIGEELRKQWDQVDPDILLNDEERLERDPALEGLFNKPDYISPLDDLAFDMYQDPEIAQIIRRLERKKQEAVLQERYDYAKRLKTAITELQKVGEKLGKMEVEKRQAVENEDYDKANRKKVKMDEYRLQVYKDLDLNSLLELEGSRLPQPIDFESVRVSTPPRLVLPLESPRSPPRYDDRPLPRRPVIVEEDLDDLEENDISQEPEPMSEVDLREASTAIDVFGLPLVSKAYSKTWSYREDALTVVYRQMQDMPGGNKEEVKSVMRAAIFLVKRGIDDKVYAVFKAALNLLKMILTEFVPRHRLGKADMTYAVEKSISNLFHKSADTAVRNRDDAKSFIYEMADFRDPKLTNSVNHECVKPFKLNLGPRFAQSRCEILETIYKKFGLKKGLTMDNMMTFNVQALQHNASEVREVTERLVRQMYKDHGAPVKDYLPPDDDKIRKNTQWRQLFEYFDEVDGKPSKADLRRQKAEDETKKQAEIDTLQKQLMQLKEMNAGKAPIDPQALKGSQPKKGAMKKKLEPKFKGKTSKEDDDVSMYTMDNTCIFCGERDESFTEEGLDIHYWKSCPMLKRCMNCKQVVEIATYTDHEMSECEAKGNFGKCPRCSEAVPKSEYDEHVAEKSCNASKPGLNHCPLCHENVPSGEDGWKNHLMGKNGCIQNPRRLLALNKTTGATGSKPAGRGRGGAARGRR